MLVRQVYDDHLAQAAYLIGCQATGEAIVMDPERDIDRYVEIAAREGLRIVAASETHIHADFLSGARQLAEELNVTLYLSDEGGEDWRYRWLDASTSGRAYDVRLLRDGDRFSIGNIDFEARHTPGHTPEHLSYFVTDRGGGATEPMGVISGDFVFVGDLGRPDLLETAAGVVGAKDAAARLLATSAERFLELDDYLQVWPGHGAGSACGKAMGAVPQTTVGYERRFNPALRLAGRSSFLDFVLSDQPSPPLYFGRMKRENRDGPPLLSALPEPRHLDVSQLSADRVLLDTRPTAEFAAGHVAGAISAPLGASFAAVAGSYVAPGEEIQLIVRPERVQDATRVLVRIGLDDVVGWLDPADLRAQDLVQLPQIDTEALGQRLMQKPLLIDVRSPDEYLTGSLPGATNIPYTSLSEALDRLPRDRELYLHCATGSRSVFAASLLRQRGLDAVHVLGGIEAWVASGRALEPPASGGSA